MKRCIVGIGRPDDADVSAPGKPAPTVRLPSLATLAAVLSDGSRAPLRLMREAKPKTLTELAALSGRQVPNLSRMLRMMEEYGLVALTKNARQARSTALATEFLVLLD
jgi:predicted transcriptional regulator